VGCELYNHLQFLEDGNHQSPSSILSNQKLCSWMEASAQNQPIAPEQLPESFIMDSRRTSLNEAPTLVPTPRLSAEKLSSTTGEDGKLPGVVLTTTNTIDTFYPDSQTVNPEDEPAPALAAASTARKIALLIMFTLAEFLDAFNNSALFPAIPDITSQLQFEPSETVWIISAYQLTFAAFLLVSGRVSDGELSSL